MPDITMCKGGDCTIKEYCHRYTTKPDEYRQTYFVEPPFTKKMGGTACAYYMESRDAEKGLDELTAYSQEIGMYEE